MNEAFLKIIEEQTGFAIKPASVFTVKPASQWMNEASIRPMPKSLFGGLFKTGELVVFFADTGIGKTILAVQIANNVSRGISEPPFVNESEPQITLYIDFELTDKQFQIRYTSPDNGAMYEFNHNFLRAEVQSDEDITDEMIMESIESQVIQTGATCLVVDNISYLKNETDKGRNALPLMKQLNHLKKKYGLSILVLAHTPKRDGTRPIHLSDLYGSSQIANFVDGAFAIGRSSDGNNFRYLKQLKSRTGEVEFHADNVINLELIRHDNMLQFIFNEFGREDQHLKQESRGEKDELIERIKELSEKGLSQRKIAEQIDRSVGFVNKILKQ